MPTGVYPRKPRDPDATTAKSRDYRLPHNGYLICWAEGCFEYVQQGEKFCAKHQHRPHHNEAQLTAGRAVP